MNAFARVSAILCLVVGLLRIASSFIPYVPMSPWQEGLYAFIDSGLLIGLVGIFVHAADSVGRIGLVAFLVALAGVASIVGPDSDMFGTQWYLVGGTVFVFGLAVLAIQLIRARVLMLTGGLWLVCLVSSVAVGMGGGAIAFIGAGVLLGGGYVVAGAHMIRRPTAE